MVCGALALVARVGSEASVVQVLQVADPSVPVRSRDPQVVHRVVHPVARSAASSVVRARVHAPLASLSVVALRALHFVGRSVGRMTRRLGSRIRGRLRHLSHIAPPRRDRLDRHRRARLGHRAAPQGLLEISGRSAVHGHRPGPDIRLCVGLTHHRLHRRQKSARSSGLAGDPFARLGFERAYSMETSSITRARVSLLAKLHPDRHIDDLSRAQALRDAAEVNEAARVLVDPEARAQALLDLMDPSGAPVSLSTDELMELMERREAAQGVRRGSREAAALESWIVLERDRLRVQVARALDMMPKAPSSARHALARLKAIARLEDELTRGSP